MKEEKDVDQLLKEWALGDITARDRIFSLIHKDVNKLASYAIGQLNRSPTLHTGDLANEAISKILKNPPDEIANRAHLVAIFAIAIKHALYDHYKKRNRLKRGGSAVKLQTLKTYDGGMTLDAQKLEKLLLRLKIIDPRTAEIIELRFFGGATFTDISEFLKISESTAKREWRVGRQWLEIQLKYDF